MYLGNKPSEIYKSMTSQQITGNGSASYTLNKTVTTDAEIAVFVNNVRQNPNTYSVSGSTLTLGGTISASDECYVVYLGQTMGTIAPPDASVTADKLASTLDLSSKTLTLPASSVTAHASDYISWQSVVTSATLTAVAGRGYPIDTSSNACTVTLPASASVGDTIKFVDYARNWGTNAVTINTNSLKFQGDTSPNPVYRTNGQAVTITYVDTTKGWIPTVDDDTTLETPQPYTIEWLVIGGGGSGATGYRSGGGGAGGYRNSYASETSGGGGSTETAWSVTGETVITVTVGAGGNNGTTASQTGTNGGSSSISGSGLTTITSYGGGGGGHHTSSNDNQSGTWGSSGGMGHYDSIESVTTGGTANQGYAGGGIVGLNPYYVGGGGGGAGSAGYGGGSANADSGDGGSALSSSITGTSVARAGGGGAGGYYSSTTHADEGQGGGGGAGDGGTDHTSPLQDGENATTASDGHNSGSGGGGSGGPTTAGTGDGANGIVILRMATARYTGTTSGSPTVVVDGSDTVLIFNSSGSYTA